MIYNHQIHRACVFFLSSHSVSVCLMQQLWYMHQLPQRVLFVVWLTVPKQIPSKVLQLPQSQTVQMKCDFFFIDKKIIATMN